MTTFAIWKELNYLLCYNLMLNRTTILYYQAPNKKQN